MSTQVVIPTNPARVKPVPVPSTAPRSSSFTNKLNRFRAPRKPEIQVDKEELKKRLTPLQYKVTQEKFTERPYSGEYLKLNEDGIYCCVVCGEELFSSESKYDSGCGWPAFFNAIDNDKFILQADLSHVGGNLLLLALNQDLARTEVTCAKCGSHVGHIFNDGPKPTGKRYCVNSNSLKFKKESELNCDPETCQGCSMAHQSSAGSIKSAPFRPSTTEPPSAMAEVKKPVLVSKSNSLQTTKAVEDKTKPIDKIDTATTCDSSHMRRVQAVRDNFFKSMITTTDSANTRTNSSLRSSSLQPSSFRLKKSNTLNGTKPLISPTKETPPIPKSDVNNNRPNVGKYSGVKSRYLDHLDMLSKQSVLKHTLGPRKSLPGTFGGEVSKTFLETDL